MTRRTLLIVTAIGLVTAGLGARQAQPAITADLLTGLDLRSIGPALTTGRTRQNKLVHFWPGRPLRPGTFAEVRVDGAGAHHLTGELVDVTAAPRHRTRIPVATAS